MSTQIKDFLTNNNLKQCDLARFLGITEGAVSHLIKGKANLSRANLNKLLNNDKGWDTSMLEESSGDKFEINSTGNMEFYNRSQKVSSPTSAEVELLKVRVKILEEQLASERERANRYWAMIEKLTTK